MFVYIRKLVFLYVRGPFFPQLCGFSRFRNCVPAHPLKNQGQIRVTHANKNMHLARHYLPVMIQEMVAKKLQPVLLPICSRRDIESFLTDPVGRSLRVGDLVLDAEEMELRMGGHDDSPAPTSPTSVHDDVPEPAAPMTPPAFPMTPFTLAPPLVSASSDGTKGANPWQWLFDAEALPQRLEIALRTRIKEVAAVLQVTQEVSLSEDEEPTPHEEEQPTAAAASSSNPAASGKKAAPFPPIGFLSAALSPGLPPITYGWTSFAELCMYGLPGVTVQQMELAEHADARLNRPSVLECMRTLTPGPEQPGGKGPARGKSCLHLAAFSKMGKGGTGKGAEVYLLLCQRGRDAQILDLKDDRGSTALHIAVAHGNVEFAEKLLQVGAGVTHSPRRTTNGFYLF